MQLSWSLMILMISIVDEIGNGIASVVLEPFRNDDGVIEAVSLGSIIAQTNAGNGAGWFNAAAAGALGAGGLTLGIAGILSLAFTTLLGVLIGFLVLILRNMVIVAALIFAPLAIVTYIVPGTEKFGKFWWDAFSKGLLMFPLIMVLFTTGRIFAWITGSSENATSGRLFDNAFQFIIVVVSYVAPYFMIPATFKLAGGAIATLGGMANDKSRGFFDRAKKKRGERIHENIAKAKAGKRWDENTGPKIFGKTIGKRFNKLADFASEPVKYSGYQLGKRGVPGMRKFSSRIGAEIRNAGVEQSAKVLEKLNSTGMFNDKAYRAIAGAFGEWNTKGLEALAVDEDKRTDNQKRAIAVRQGLIDSEFMDKEGKTLKTAHSLNDFNKLAEVMDKGGETERIAGNALRNEAGYLATVHEDPEMAYASTVGAGIMGLASHGFASGADIASVANYESSHGNGREFAHAIATRAQVLGQGQRPDIKAGYGVLVDPKTGKFVDGMDLSNPQSKARAKAWLRTVKQQDWLGAKAGAVQKARALIFEEAMETEMNPDKTVKMENFTEQYKADDGTIQERVSQRPVFTANAKALRESIMLGASAYSSSDVDAKVEWQRIADETGLSDQVQNADRYRALMEAQAKAAGPGMNVGNPTAGGPTMGQL